MIPSWAKVGAKVVCVDDYWFGYKSPLNTGQVYTIKSIGRSALEAIVPDGVSRNGLVFELVEAVNPEDAEFASGYWPGFSACRFRPLITKTQEQDIEMFLRIANDTPFHVMVDEETNA